jgi:hypothetical protein
MFIVEKLEAMKFERFYDKENEYISIVGLSVINSLSCVTACAMQI